MRKVFMAIALAGALALGSVQALADSDSTLTKAGELALQGLKQARANCFNTLEATFDSISVPDSKEALAKAELQKARNAIDLGTVKALDAISGLKAALEAVEDEDEDGATQAQLTALATAIATANTATIAIPTACTTANTTLHNALVALAAGAPAVEDEDEDEADSDNDSQANTAKVTVKHEKRDHEKKQEHESDSERD